MFPTDPETLDLLEAGITTPVRSSLMGTLDLLSGYDPSHLVPTDDPDVYEDPNPTWHPNQVILALITEVRRLRCISRTPE